MGQRPPAMRHSPLKILEAKQSPQQAILQAWKSREVPMWARPREVTHAQLRVEQAWLRTRGHVPSGMCMGEHTETLNRVLNEVVPSVPKPPPQQWPASARGADRGKEDYADKLYDRLSDQRGAEFYRVSVESVCLAHHMVKPIARTVPVRQAPVFGAAWKPLEEASPQRVHLPKLQLQPDCANLQAATFNMLNSVAATPRFAQLTGTVARQNFSQVKEGWQPWRTHRSSAFDTHPQRSRRNAKPPFTVRADSSS